MKIPLILFDLFFTGGGLNAIGKLEKKLEKPFHLGVVNYTQMLWKNVKLLKHLHFTSLTMDHFSYLSNDESFSDTKSKYNMFLMKI